MPAYMALSDIGFATAATHQMTILVADQKRDEAIAIFQSTQTFVFGISLLLLILILLVIFFLPIDVWFNFSMIRLPEIKIVLLLLSFQVFIGLQSAVLYAGFNCDGQYGLGMFCLSFIRLFEFALLVFGVVFGAGPESVAGLYLAGRLVGYVVMRMILRRKVTWLNMGIRQCNWETIGGLWRPSVAFMGFPLGNFFNIQGMVLIVGALAGPTMVVVFSSLRTLTRLTTQIVTAINASVRPEISKAFGREDFELIRVLHRRTVQASLWMAGLIVIFLFIFGAVIVQAWTAGRVAVINPFFLILLATVFTNSVWWGSLNVLYGTNRHQQLAIVYSIANAGFVLAAFPLVTVFNINGGAAALLGAELVIGSYTIWRTIAFIDEDFGKFAREIVKPPLFLLDQVRDMIRKRKDPSQ